MPAVHLCKPVGAGEIGVGAAQRGRAGIHHARKSCSGCRCPGNSPRPRRPRWRLAASSRTACSARSRSRPAKCRPWMNPGSVMAQGHTALRSAVILVFSRSLHIFHQQQRGHQFGQAGQRFAASSASLFKYHDARVQVDEIELDCAVMDVTFGELVARRQRRAAKEK